MIPLSVTWIKRLLYLRIGLILLLLLLSFVAVLWMPRSGFFLGFLWVLHERGLYFPYETGESLGLILGAYIFPLVFSFLLYFSLVRKKKVFFYGVAILDFLVVVANSGLPLLPLIILILAVLKTTRQYFSQSLSELDSEKMPALAHLNPSELNSLTLSKTSKKKTKSRKSASRKQKFKK